MPVSGINVSGTDLSLDFQGYIERALIETPKPYLVHGLFPVRAKVPLNAGQKINFNQPQRLLPLALTSPVEGQNPPGIAVSSVYTTVQLNELVNFFVVSSKLLKHSPWPVLDTHVPLLRNNWAETIDKIIQQTLIGGTNVFRANNVASNALINSAALGTDLERIETNLINNFAMYIEEMVGAQDLIGTLPIDPAFIAFCHPDPAKDIQKLPGFIRSRQYSDQGRLLPGEFGSYNRIRFLYSQQADDGTFVQGNAAPAPGLKTNNGGLNTAVYRIPIVGFSSYAAVDFTDPEVIVKLGYNAAGQQSDAMNRASSFGWSQDFASTILVQQWMANYYVAATA
jgi:N4-gp56 family major capsid protein